MLINDNLFPKPLDHNDPLDFHEKHQISHTEISFFKTVECKH
jgi:hypothetical protein